MRKRFKRGWEHIKDDTRSDRPTISMTEENIKKVSDLNTKYHFLRYPDGSLDCFQLTKNECV